MTAYKQQKTYLGVTGKSQSVLLQNENALKTSSLIEEALQFKNVLWKRKKKWPNDMGVQKGQNYEHTHTIIANACQTVWKRTHVIRYAHKRHSNNAENKPKVSRISRLTHKLKSKCHAHISPCLVHLIKSKWHTITQKIVELSSWGVRQISMLIYLGR